MAPVHNFCTAGTCGTCTRSRECAGLDDGCIRCDGCAGNRNYLLYRIVPWLQLPRIWYQTRGDTIPAALGMKFCSAQCTTLEPYLTGTPTER